jgi:hypothetical protein
VNVELKAGSCGHCGAPLPVVAGPIVVCGFCGRQYHAQPLTAPPLAPPRFPAPVPPTSSVSHSRRGLPLVVIGGLGLVAMALVILSAVLIGSGRGVDSPPAPARTTQQGTALPSPDTPRAWYSHSEQALFKGDGVPNIVGLAGLRGGGTHLMALEGKSGKRLWSVPDNGSSDVYADGDDVILIYNPTNTLTRRDAKTGAVKWTINVSAFVHDITFGPGCASVRLDKAFGVDTQTGAPKDCKPTREALLRVERAQLHDVTLQQGDVVFRCGIQTDSKPINPEPARFAIAIQRGKSPPLNLVPRELSPVWSSDGFSRSVALTPTGLFVYGRDPTDLSARWLLIDGDGRSKYSLSGPSKVKDTVRVTDAGPLVFVSHDRRLEAYQAATGSLLWLVGEP